MWSLFYLDVSNACNIGRARGLVNYRSEPVSPISTLRTEPSSSRFFANARRQNQKNIAAGEAIAQLDIEQIGFIHS